MNNLPFHFGNVIPQICKNTIHPPNEKPPHTEQTSKISHLPTHGVHAQLCAGGGLSSTEVKQLLLAT